MLVVVRGVTRTRALLAQVDIHFAVIARLDRAIQYAEAPRLEPRCLGLLDARFRGHDEEKNHV
jgi:hypothetical protein